MDSPIPYAHTIEIDERNATSHRSRKTFAWLDLKSYTYRGGIIVQRRIADAFKKYH